MTQSHQPFTPRSHRTSSFPPSIPPSAYLQSHRVFPVPPFIPISNSHSPSCSGFQMGVSSASTHHRPLLCFRSHLVWRCHLQLLTDAIATREGRCAIKNLTAEHKHITIQGALVCTLRKSRNTNEILYRNLKQWIYFSLKNYCHT